MSDLPANLGPRSQTIGNTARVDSGPGWLESSWWQQLQPGSWRGIGFVMDAAEAKTGRRIAMHEYPYRDTVWPEDLGKLPRRFTFQAWLVGDDVYQQRNRMIEAAEKEGPGTLVHPTFGSIECVCLEFGAIDRRERGRFVELTFQFVVASDLLFPQAVQATGAAVGEAADKLDDASEEDLGDLETTPAIASRSVAAYGGEAVSAVNDPARALSAVAGLQGLFGRYASGKRGTVQAATATVASLLAASTASRAKVLTAVDTLNATAKALS